jgi:hypothetical protein
MPAGEEEAPQWIPPAIIPLPRSPIQLRQHSSRARRTSEGTTGDPIFLGGENASDHEDFVVHDSVGKFKTDSDCEMLDGGALQMPPPP